MNKPQKVSFIPHPDKVLVKITKASYDELFFKRIIRDDGKEVSLFTSIEEKEGMDDRYKQNVSVGVIVAVGKNVDNIFITDLAILDYMVSNDSDNLVGFVNGDRIVSLVAKTTYHNKSAKPDINFRKAYVKGDYDEVSKILGVVRKKQVIAFDPYIFLNSKSNKILSVLPNGQLTETIEYISKRDVLSADAKSNLKFGDEILLKEEDMFGRVIENKEISVIFKNYVLCKKTKLS
jgi:hypothetical protein